LTFDPTAICRILNEEGVDYVVMGGFAAVIHGSPLPTEDVDILPDRRPDNLERLASALARLGARIRTAGDPVATTIDAGLLAEMPHMLTLVTDFGILDLAFTPAGPLDGYDAWNAGSSSIEIADRLTVRVAGLDDVIDSKAAANRPKDVRALPYLESLREAIFHGD
jgi:hypothetical protein